VFRRGLMGRKKRGGYIFEWWMGDHTPKHVHVYKNGIQIAKIGIPNLIVLQGAMTKKLKKILQEMIKEKIL